MTNADRARALFEKEYFTPAIDCALLAAAECEGDERTEMRALAAMGLERKRQLLASIRIADEVLADKPDHAGALTARGSARTQLLQPDLGRADLDRAVELAPDSERAWECLAYAAFDTNDTGGVDRAIENLERLDAMSGYIYRLRGERRLAAGDSGGAETDLRRAAFKSQPMAAFQLVENDFELKTGDERALFGLDRAKRDLVDDAITEYRAAIDMGFESETRDPKVTRNLARLLVDQGKTDEAIAAACALTERRPDDGAAWLVRAQIDGESSSFDKAFELDPEAAAVPLARHHLAAGRLEDARMVCVRRLEQDPDDMEARLALADILRAAGDDDKAKDAYRASEALGSSDARRARVAAYGIETGLDHFDAGLDLLDQHRKQDAIAEFDKAVELLREETEVPGDEASRYLAKSLHNGAFLRELKVDDTEIEPPLLEALELDPSYTDVMLLLGNLCLRNDRTDEGLDWFARAGDIDPRAGQGWFYRARHFAKHGDDAQTVIDATKAYDAYSRRGQHRFAGDAAMLRGQANEALGKLYDAKRDYDLAYECGHPTGYAMGDNIRERIAIEHPESEEAGELIEKVVDRLHQGECPWGQIDFLESRTAKSEKATAMVERLKSDEVLSKDEIEWLGTYLYGG